MEGVSERMAAKTPTRSKSRRNGSSHRSFSSFGIHVPICFSSISSQMKGPLQELPIGHSSTPLLSFGSMHHPASAFGVPIIVCAKRRPPAATPSVRGDFTPTFGAVHSDAYVHIYLISVASGFPFPSNGKAHSDPRVFYQRRLLYFRVSIPFKREGTFRPDEADEDVDEADGSVSIPFKREGTFRQVG